MSNSSRLTIGSRILYDGENWTVYGFGGADIKLRSSRGKITLIAVNELVNSQDFKLLGDKAGVIPSDNNTTFPDNVPEEVLRKAQKLLEHLNEIETGYRSGNITTALTIEPKAEYDVSERTLNQRVESKARELAIGVRTLWKFKALYKSYGIYGLCDQRAVRSKQSRIDPRIISALNETVIAIADLSTVTKQSIVRRAIKLLRERYPDEQISFPSTATLNRLIDQETKGKSVFGSAKGRRSIYNRPPTTYRQFSATRPGEMVLIDTTSFDAFAMNPVTFEWIQIQLTIALDLATRSIVGWRFTPVSTKAVDATLLLYDVIRPKPMRKGWPESARWSYVGIPEHIVIELARNNVEDGVANIPILRPDTVVVDHGKIFISQAFKDACVRIGTSLQLARPYTPTDKSHVERIFKTIRENFVMELPGYKGPDIFSRGKNPGAEAYFFLDEIDAEFAEWVATWYQTRYHDGLDLPGLPHLNISPNNMYSEGMGRAGFVHVVTDENMYYELLPTAWRTIQHYGVELNGLRYDGDILNDFRNKKSEYTGENKDKWPIRYDPRDLSQAFFFDSQTYRWHVLHWLHSEGDTRPFNEATVGYAKSLVITRQGNPKNSDELAEMLNQLIDRLSVPSTVKKERRMAGINAMHAKLVNEDRPVQKSKHVPPDADADLFSEGVLRGTRKSMELPDDPVSEFESKLKSVDEVMEDDDDELGF